MPVALALFVAIILAMASASHAATPCSSAKTQADLNRCACDEARAAETRLQNIYQTLLSARSGQPGLSEKIRRAQEAWKAFRDASLEIIQESFKEGGSVEPMCLCFAAADLATARADQLERARTAPEGDVCRW